MIGGSSFLKHCKCDKTRNNSPGRILSHDSWVRVSQRDIPVAKQPGHMISRSYSDQWMAMRAKNHIAQLSTTTEDCFCIQHLSVGRVHVTQRFSHNSWGRTSPLTVYWCLCSRTQRSGLGGLQLGVEKEFFQSVHIAIHLNFL